MTIPRAKTADEYVKQVEQALAELEELRACYEYDMEDPGEHLRYLDPLIEGVRRLRASMVDGSYFFENKELPFMPLVTRFRERLPCSQLLASINETHRKGLDIES